MAIEDHPVTALGTYDEPTWAETPTVAPVAPSAPVAAAGLGSVTLVSTLFNYLFRQPYRWIRALAHRTPRSDLGLIGSYVQTGGVYTTMGGTLSVALPLTEVWVEGVLIQIADALSSPHVFSASRDSYLFVESDGTRTDVEVGNGAAAPAGPGGTAVLVSKTVTDGTQVTASTRLLTNVVTLGAIAVDGLLSLGSDLDCNNFDILDANEITAAGPITVTGDVASGSVTTTGNVSIGGNLDMTSGSISNVTTIGTTGDVSIGGNLDLTSGTISNVTTLTTSGNISCGGNLDLTSGSISNVTTIGSSGLASLGSLSTASAIITSLDCGLSEFSATVNASTVSVRMLEADFTSTTLTVDAGEVRWDGTKLAVGDGTSAKPIAVYYEVFEAGPVGPVGALAGSIVTGSSIAVALTIGDIVWVEGGFETTNSANTTPSAGLEVNDGGGTTVLHATTRKIVAGDYADVNLRYKYTAVSTATHTFRMTHGAATGNTTTRNIGVTVRRTL